MNVILNPKPSIRGILLIFVLQLIVEKNTHVQVFFTMPNIETIYYISKVPSNSSLCYCHPKKASCLSLNSVDVLQIGSDTVIDLEPINLLEDNSDKLFQMSTLFPNFIVESWAVISHLRFGDSDIEGLVISDISDEHYNNVLELLEQAKGDIHE